MFIHFYMVSLKSAEYQTKLHKDNQLCVSCIKIFFWEIQFDILYFLWICKKVQFYTWIRCRREFAVFCGMIAMKLIMTDFSDIKAKATVLWWRSAEQLPS